MDLVEGGVDSQGGYVSKILYVKTKELGPLGGGGGACRAHPPRSANVDAVAYPGGPRGPGPPWTPNWRPQTIF